MILFYFSELPTWMVLEHQKMWLRKVSHKVFDIFIDQVHFEQR